MTDLQSFYSANTAKYKEDIKTLSGHLRLVALLRLATFALCIFGVYRMFKNFNAGTAIFVGMAFAAFLWLVSKSSALGSKKWLLQKLLFINENELAILQGQPNGFDNGSHFQTGERYLADLDIFGESSIYHYLNRTSSSNGSDALANILKKPLKSVDAIEAQQHAVKNLASQPALREMVVAKAALYNPGAASLHQVQLWLYEPARISKNRWMSVARFIIPALNILALGVSIYSGKYHFLSLTVLISWLHVGYYGKYTNRQHMLLGKKEEVLNQYAEILREFMKVQTEGSVVLNQNKTLASEGHRQIRGLSRLAGLLDQRLNLLVNIFLNSFLLYDIQCLLALETWKAANNNRLQKWIDCAGTVECLTSLATFSFNHASYCFPTIEPDRAVLVAEGMSHPLIKAEKSVSNAISIGVNNKLLIITGSNMSGKTTFLRAVGVNTLLAQCGLPVCAGSFHFSPFDIYTSIRISDSLQENTSYFMAELKRLSEIKEHIAQGGPSLVLIDEILRGTNSDDKYFGSEQFVHRLVQYNCLTLFATHDLKLSELEDALPGVVENYCFESSLRDDDELFFDYRIHKGVAQNKNASFLMKKMGII